MNCGVGFCQARCPGGQLQLHAFAERSVDDEVGVGDETGTRAGEEDHSVGHFLGCAHAPCWIHAESSGEELWVPAFDLAPHATGEVGIAR